MVVVEFCSLLLDLMGMGRFGLAMDWKRRANERSGIGDQA
jgi:hypothetical protein